MMPTRMLGAVVWAALSAVLVAQTPSAPARAFEVFEIRYPDADSYLAGPVVLRAVVEPPGAVAKLTFFVDGREVCVVDGPPFECDWDAGQNVVERQIRVEQRVRGQDRAGQGERAVVAVDVIGMTVGVDHVRDRQALRASPLHEDVRSIRRIDQHAGPCLTVTQQVAEVSIAAGTNLLEDELHRANLRRTSLISPVQQFSDLGFDLIEREGLCE